MPFPFLVLLVSGGHCILAVARGVGDFLVLGNTTDDAPGEAFDKASRFDANLIYRITTVNCVYSIDCSIFKTTVLIFTQSKGNYSSIDMG